MAETITAAPCRASRDATQPMRSMFVSRSAFEKPRPLDRCSRTSSPSSHSTRRPRRSSSGRTSSAIVVFPAPLRPVNQSAKPLPLAAAWSSRPPIEPFSVIRLLDQWCVDVDAALELVRARPASRALVLAAGDGPRARNAADRGIALVVQRVVWDLVDVDVRLHALRVPIDDRLHLPHAVALGPLDLLRVGARHRLLATDARDPRVVGGERALERLDLADVAAAVGVCLPEPVGRIERAERLQVQAVALDQPVARLVRLWKEDERVERANWHVKPELAQHVDQHRR